MVRWIGDGEANASLTRSGVEPSRFARSKRIEGQRGRGQRTSTVNLVEQLFAREDSVTYQFETCRTRDNYSADASRDPCQKTSPRNCGHEGIPFRGGSGSCAVSGHSLTNSRTATPNQVRTRRDIVGECPTVTAKYFHKVFILVLLIGIGGFITGAGNEQAR